MYMKDEAEHLGDEIHYYIVRWERQNLGPHRAAVKNHSFPL